jgi:hypothetical protein
MPSCRGDRRAIAALESARRVEALSSRAAAALDKIHGRAPKDNPD